MRRKWHYQDDQISTDLLVSERFAEGNVRNLGWPDNCCSNVDGTADRADNEEHGKTSDVLEEMHRNERIGRPPVGFPQPENNEEDCTRYEKSQDSRR